MRIRKELDFEKQQFFNLTLIAEDRGIPSLISQTFVEVEVCNTHTHMYTHICIRTNFNDRFDQLSTNTDVITLSLKLFKLPILDMMLYSNFH